MKQISIKSIWHAGLLIAVLLSGCSLTKPDAEKLLPDSSPTTAELIEGVRGKVQSVFYDGNGPADYLGMPLVEDYAPNSSRSLEHVNELQRDFHQVPNPQITAYVFPHLGDGELPVPGYFTVFNLYETNHYALEQEGHHEIR